MKRCSYIIRVCICTVLIIGLVIIIMQIYREKTLTNWNAFQRPLLVGLSENVVILVWVSFGQIRSV